MSQIIIGREYPDLLIEKIKNSKQSVKILMFAWRWYDGEVGAKIQKFNNEIIRASQRGVAVRAVCNFDHIASKLKPCGVDIKKIESKKMMHVKMIIIDEKIVFLGSHNLTKNAFEINHEVSVMIEEPLAVARCNNFFESIK
jgi:phosphatidylserine/phosphatidylglycerophosphate/cardiolipin synthase-like enzyme